MTMFSIRRVCVPDKRLDELDEYYKPKSKKEAFLTVTDIAGLVKGASKGAGLGNAFLSNISSVDGIYHVIRNFSFFWICILFFGNNSLFYRWIWW